MAVKDRNVAERQLLIGFGTLTAEDWNRQGKRSSARPEEFSTKPDASNPKPE